MSKDNEGPAVAAPAINTLEEYFRANVEKKLLVCVPVPGRSTTYEQLLSTMGGRSRVISTWRAGPRPNLCCRSCRLPGLGVLNVSLNSTHIDTPVASFPTNRTEKYPTRKSTT
jgi:hypothetical protein